jgi:membrane protein
MRVRFKALIQLLRSTWSEYERDYARYFAVAIVYYALISLVPLLLLLLATMGLLLRSSEAAASLQQQLLSAVDGNFGPQLRSTIDGSLQRIQQQSLTASLISLVALLVAASVLFIHLRMTFRAIWKHAAPLVSGRLAAIVRTTLLERVLSFGIVAGAAATLLIVVGLLVVVQWMKGVLTALPFLNHDISWAVPLTVAVVTVPAVFMLLFKVLPPVHLSLRHTWLAAILCAVAWLIGAEVLGLFGSYFGKNLGTYGALGSVLVLMLWMKIMSQVLFFGAELCKVIYTTES